MRSRIPFRRPTTCVSGRADALGFDRSHASGDSDAVLALARSETFPHLSIFALLLLLGQARVEVGHTLSLRLLRSGAPLVVVRLIGEVISWHHGCGERRCHWRPRQWPDFAPVSTRLTRASQLPDSPVPVVCVGVSVTCVAPLLKGYLRRLSFIKRRLGPRKRSSRAISDCCSVGRYRLDPALFATFQ
jgi:hypothetical protein